MRVAIHPAVPNRGCCFIVRFSVARHRVTKRPIISTLLVNRRFIHFRFPRERRMVRHSADRKGDSLRSDGRADIDPILPAHLAVLDPVRR
uniref:Uncharacterized protein n=1 Tax=Candidatus Kentrum sp. LPFa TaxID=2126335 RepID=A0A450XG13_9GAMM|nr:MAG: hypothetical protein BECKLPF1236A_GA0070988_1006610 [Candidatus Kentron sp. LPFa]VFK28174.1 MAG: hypothetical protein BECKLPF1236C_GA0070990_1006012 [Candidatus Kentron sp. LPFa]